jgi:hypothetical protein
VCKDMCISCLRHVQGLIVHENDEMKEFLARPALPYVLRLLQGVCPLLTHGGVAVDWLGRVSHSAGW